MFLEEKVLSDVFKNFLTSKILNCNINYLVETPNLFGVPDYILIEKTKKNMKYIVTFELKLRNWKQALKQAFRYKVFSHESYVLLDEKNINAAYKNIYDFKKFNVGLASLNDSGDFKIYYAPIPHIPFSEFYVNNLEKNLIKEKVIDDSIRKIDLWKKINSKILKKKLNKFLIEGE